VSFCGFVTVFFVPARCSSMMGFGLDASWWVFVCRVRHELRLDFPCQGSLSFFYFSPESIDYRREVGRSVVPTRCVTVSNPNSLSSNEKEVNPGIRSWIKHYLIDFVFRKAIGCICFTKMWRPEILQPGLEFDILKPLL
jgi:hypothetical protein